MNLRIHPALSRRRFGSFLTRLLAGRSPARSLGRATGALLAGLGCGLLLCLPAGPRCFGADSAKVVRGELSVIAGALSGQGYRDGTLAIARFSYPLGLTTNPAGTILVADSRNNVIRRIDPNGEVSTCAGAVGRIGSADGRGADAGFNSPADVAVDGAGNVYVADSANNTIRKITPGGIVSTLAGVAGKTGSADGAGTAAEFNGPAALVVDPTGNIYVTDSGNNTVRKVTATGVVTTFAGTAGKSGAADGAGPAALFNGPSGMTVDATGAIFVADTGNNAVRKITANRVVHTVPGLSGRLNGPGGVGCDRLGNVYVADANNNVIVKMGADGAVTTLAGRTGQTGSADGIGEAARFKGPTRMTVDGNGNILVTDNNGQIRQITPVGVVTTLAGAPAQSGNADGVGTTARFSYTNGIALDQAGNLYVADMDNGTIRKITHGGAVTTFAGKAGGWGNTDGQGAAASFGGVGTIAIDAAGNVFAAEFYNNAIRKITSTGLVTTFAGASGQAGSLDGRGTAAQFSGPNDIAADASGDVYVADFYNNTIRKITSEGIVSTIAGSPGKSGQTDGIGAVARFSGPAGVAAGGDGCVYVTELNNHTVRKITPGGAVTTLAGMAGQAGYADGVGSAARFSQPWGIARDRNGNLYVCDSGNNSIRRISPTGRVETIVGGPGPYWNCPGDLPARLAYPIGIIVDPGTGDLYVTVPDAVLKVTFKPTAQGG